MINRIDIANKRIIIRNSNDTKIINNEDSISNNFWEGYHEVYNHLIKLDRYKKYNCLETESSFWGM